MFKKTNKQRNKNKFRSDEENKQTKKRPQVYLFQ